MAVEQDLRSRSDQLMSRQAEAINHLGSNEPVVRGAGVQELVWLMHGWTTLTVNSLEVGHEDAVSTWVEHVQQLVDLVYKQKPSSSTEMLDQTTTTRVRGLIDLNKQLMTIPDPDMEIRLLDFSDAELSNMCLCDINFKGANFNGARFTDSDLSRSEFAGADFCGADLRTATLDEERFKGAFYNGRTHLDGHMGLRSVMKYKQ